MRTYAVQATCSYVTADGWQGTRQVPTFLLCEDVQGITDEAHAERIARDVVDPFGLCTDVHVSVCVTTADLVPHGDEVHA